MGPLLYGMFTKDAYEWVCYGTTCMCRQHTFVMDLLSCIMSTLLTLGWVCFHTACRSITSTCVWVMAPNGVSRVFTFAWVYFVQHAGLERLPVYGSGFSHHV